MFKLIKERLFSRTDAQIRVNLGIPTKADVQDNIVKQYADCLSLRERMDKRAEQKIAEDPTIQVSYDWTDVDSHRRRNRENLQILKNQIEVLKFNRAGVKDLTNVTIAYGEALKQAIADYINGNRDYVVAGLIDQMKKNIKENKYNAFNFIPDVAARKKIEIINNYNDIVSICKQMEYLKFQIENSEEWHRAHVSRDIVNSKKR